MEDFYRQKIVYSEIVREPQFYLDNTGEFFPEATTFIMTGSHLEYLIQILHSKTVTYFFKTFYAGGGLGENGIRYKKAFLENLPLPTNFTNKDYTEREIMKLYDFTEEEISYLENINNDVISLYQ